MVKRFSILPIKDASVFVGSDAVVWGPPNIATETFDLLHCWKVGLLFETPKTSPNGSRCCGHRAGVRGGGRRLTFKTQLFDNDASGIDVCRFIEIPVVRMLDDRPYSNEIHANNSGPVVGLFVFKIWSDLHISICKRTLAKCPFLPSSRSTHLPEQLLVHLLYLLTRSPATFLNLLPLLEGLCSLPFSCYSDFLEKWLQTIFF